MKVIAIIKVPEGDGKWYLDGVIRYTENESLMKKFDNNMISLKPLPQKREPKNMNEYCWNYADRPKKQKDLLAHSLDVENAEIIGWNDCLKEIIGETDTTETETN